jgi:putative cell wall-binding protein
MLKRCLSLFAVLIVCLVFISTSVLGDALNITVTRLAGTNRYGTCEEISKYGWQKNSSYAVITTGENFPDSLSAAPLAKKYKAPIIITGKSSLSSEAAAELTRLKVTNAFIIGGAGAVSQSVEDEIKAMNIKTVRISGSDRYETSAKTAEYMDTANGVVLAAGDDYPGALFMAPIAAKKGIPILLVQKDKMPDSVKSYLSRKKVSNYYVIGGEDIISSNTVSGLSPVIRITGKDKYERNIAALNMFSKDLDYSNVYIATGEDFPDALSGSAMASMTNSPIILMVNKTLSTSARNLVNSNISKVKNIYLLGGKSVVSDITITSEGIADSGDSSGNISNDGYAATDGNYIYYTPVSGTYYGLWRMNMDGTQNTLLTYDIPRYINVYNGYVYYSNQSDNGYIYRISTDGTSRSKLISNTASYINVSNDHIYYSNDSDEGRLYRIDIDGGNKSKLNEDKSKFINVVGSNIYYSNVSNNGCIYAINTNGTNKRQINYEYSSYITVQNGEIYYINVYADGDIYELKTDGTSRLKLHMLKTQEKSIYSLNASSNMLYFKIQDSNGQMHLYRESSVMSGRTELALSRLNNITLISGNVFYN